MKQRRFAAVVVDALRRRRGMLVICAVIIVLEYVVFSLYGLALEPFWYAWILSGAVCLLYLILSVAGDWRKAKRRMRLLETVTEEWRFLKKPTDLCEADYVAALQRLGEHCETVLNECADSRRDLVDYFTVWVHQIKTPIAVLRMRLHDDPGIDRAVQTELFRLERYVDMALQYVRLDSQSRDLLIREYALDDLIRTEIRKYAQPYIAYGVQLHYDGCAGYIVTDRKWFGCLLDQLLSNAAKYAPGGHVTITVNRQGLSVTDDGIGIAPEDLPRIFEKGYTGINGRVSEKSSGLGLYLCRKAADLLDMQIQVDSQPGQGSCFTILWPEKMQGERT